MLAGKIESIKTLVANHEEIKKALAALRAREDAIAKLQTARSGPTAVLLELAQVLTRDKGPTADQERLPSSRRRTRSPSTTPAGTCAACGSPATSSPTAW